MGASAITIDSHTGEILAVSNYPSFNPNDRSTFSASAARNRVFVDQYEPGSTFKALTAVAALETGRYSADTVFETSPGWMVVQGKTFKDPVDYGQLTLAGVLAKSSQIGTTKLALDIGRDSLLPVLQRFGVGQPLGTGFPGETAGMLPQQSRWSDIEQATLAFGYGVTVSPAQLAAFYGAIANYGRLQPLTLVATAEANMPPAMPVTTPAIASELRAMLGAVTGKGGTGILANVPGFSVAGKTGTVHKAGAGGYDRKRYIAWFAGMAPADNPRFVTVVMVNEPKGESVGGGAIAAPVFADMTAAMLRILGESPNQQSPVIQLAAAAQALAGESSDG
jgi:cell division protein FtsI (penicillin-binding protein 3)